jgi:hypothetical protein
MALRGDNYVSHPIADIEALHDGNDGLEFASRSLQLKLEGLR